MADLDITIVANDELITRFVYDSDKISKIGTVKAGAFMPAFEAVSGRLETSVCRLIACTDERVWYLARTQRLDRNIKGRADHEVRSVAAAGLQCVSAPVEGFAEHALLLGWPDDKPKCKEIAVALAKASKVHFPP